MTLIHEGDRHVVVTRRFAASPEAVYRAHTDAALIRQRMLGPDGWTNDHLRIRRRPWRQDSLRLERCPRQRLLPHWRVARHGATGESLVMEPFERLVHVERMHLPDRAPDNHVETTFAPDGTGTLMTMRMTLPNAATRQAMLSTGMEQGIKASYVGLETVL